jgi:MYXO-CTERM domain-containing protein
MSHRMLVPGALLLAGMSGCGAGGAVGVSQQRIMGGTADPGDASVVDIVWLMGADGFAECSGSLIAPNVVLTAHHCVSTVNGEVGGLIACSASFAAPDVPGNFWVSTQEVLSMPPAGFHAVQEIVVPPGSTDTTFCGFDQAILILADTVDPSEAVPLVPRVDGQIAAGDGYSAIGFGLTSDTSMDSGTRRQLDGLRVECVGNDCSVFADGNLDTAHEWGGDRGVCEGDSGGPALDADDRVIGVTSRGFTGCTSPVYGDVFSWADWIEQTAAHAASVGGYAAPPWVTGYPTDPAFSDPIGGDCSSSCASNVCLADTDGQYCSRLCEAAAPCPSGYSCNTVQGFQVCQRPAPGPTGKSGCSVQSADPTKPVPWFLGTALCALALRRRRR